MKSFEIENKILMNFIIKWTKNLKSFEIKIKKLPFQVHVNELKTWKVLKFSYIFSYSHNLLNELKTWKVLKFRQKGQRLSMIHMN